MGGNIGRGDRRTRGKAERSIMDKGREWFPKWRRMTINVNCCWWVKKKTESKKSVHWVDRGKSSVASGNREIDWRGGEGCPLFSVYFLLSFLHVFLVLFWPHQLPLLLHFQLLLLLPPPALGISIAQCLVLSTNTFPWWAPYIPNPQLPGLWVTP